MWDYLSIRGPPIHEFCPSWKLLLFYYNYYFSSGLDLDAEAPLAKKPRVEGEEEEEVDFSMASLAKGEITKVG